MWHKWRKEIEREMSIERSNAPGEFHVIKYQGERVAFTRPEETGGAIDLPVFMDSDPDNFIGGAGATIYDDEPLSHIVIDHMLNSVARKLFERFVIEGREQESLVNEARALSRADTRVRGLRVPIIKHRLEVYIPKGRELPLGYEVAEPFVVDLQIYDDEVYAYTNIARSAAGHHQSGSSFDGGPDYAMKELFYDLVETLELFEKQGDDGLTGDAKEVRDRLHEHIRPIASDGARA